MKVEDNRVSSAARHVAKLVGGLPEEFASMLAHEVRNPLMNIDLSATFLKLGITNREDEKYIDIIKRGCLQIN